ncbi:MAG: DUF2299 family protein [Candidatus Lokiarchaeota archaeon]|nr:DUF2299 family protein [Candidatus Lokiarchaeota archaeon]
MLKNKNPIEMFIRTYLDEEEILRNEISNEKLEFGFMFSFPPGIEKGHMMHVFQPKKKDCVMISIGTQINSEQAKLLGSLDEEKQFFLELKKHFVQKDVFFRIDMPNARYEIVDQIFLKNDGIISKNSLYKSIRRVFNCAMYGDILLSEYCSEKMELNDFYEPKNFEPSTDFSLYS